MMKQGGPCKGHSAFLKSKTPRGLAAWWGGFASISMSLSALIILGS